MDDDPEYELTRMSSARLATPKLRKSESFGVEVDPMPGGS
jgi:hypothetical protein